MLRIFLPLLALALSPMVWAADLPPLLPKSDGGGFVDAELRAEKIETTHDGGTRILARARAGEKEVGFLVILSPIWKAWIPQPSWPGTFYNGTVRIESIGPETEAFVRAIAKAYGQKIETFDFTGITLTATSLQGDPTKVRSLPVRIKLFHESKNEEEYAEAFLNLDIPHGVVEFHEKDPDYRKAVVRFLSKKNG